LGSLAANRGVAAWLSDLEEPPGLGAAASVACSSSASPESGSNAEFQARWRPPSSPGRRWPRPTRSAGGGLIDWVITVDHKKIGILYIFTALFLFAAQVSTGLANFLVPLQIGAADVAFPRDNAMS
jgi:hypothetical protein